MARQVFSNGNFLMTPARHAEAIRASFPGESARQLCARVRHDIANSPAGDGPHLRAVIGALQSARSVAASLEG